MLENILQLLTMALALYGVTELIRLCSLWLLAPKDRGRTAGMVLLRGQKAEFDLTAAVERAKWCRFCRRDTLFAVDCGLPEDVKKRCLLVAADNDNVIFCSKPELSRYIE